MVFGLLVLAGLSLSSCESTNATKGSDTYIFLDEGDTLYIEFNLNGDLELQMSYPQIADQMKDQRREDFEQVIKSALAATQFPLPVVLVEDRSEVADGPVLNLFARRWYQDDFGEVRLMLDATLRRFGDENKVGFYKENGTPPIGFNSDKLNEAHRQVMQTALFQVLSDLNQRFRTPEEDEYLDEGIKD